MRNGIFQVLVPGMPLVTVWWDAQKKVSVVLQIGDDKHIPSDADAAVIHSLLVKES